MPGSSTGRPNVFQSSCRLDNHQAAIRFGNIQGHLAEQPRWGRLSMPVHIRNSKRMRATALFQPHKPDIRRAMKCHPGGMRRMSIPAEDCYPVHNTSRFFRSMRQKRLLGKGESGLAAYLPGLPCGSRHIQCPSCRQHDFPSLALCLGFAPWRCGTSALNGRRRRCWIDCHDTVLP